MNDEIEILNHASAVTAEAWFLECCGSRKWARMMSQARPFADIAELILKAEQTWQNIRAEDWLEAFAAHPRIGSVKAAPNQSQQSARWSSREQSGMQTATDPVRTELAEANRLYEEKFGYIFIVCATGKTAEEMLELCRQRLQNTPDAELQVAAEEQRKITEIRLKKLLAGNRTNSPDH